MKESDEKYDDVQTYLCMKEVHDCENNQCRETEIRGNFNCTVVEFP